MMFFGPNAASPPKNTLGWVERRVVSSTFGMFQRSSNSTPMSRSIQGKAFSWPTATSTSSHSKTGSGSPVGTSLRRPSAPYSARTFSKLMPTSRPASWTNALGTRKLRIGMSSAIASSFSQGDAFISSNPERTITLTSSPPRRRAVRQQSIAVLPPPSTMTRLPIAVTWPNETEDSQSMPMWMLAAASARPGMSRSRPRGAPDPTNTASQPSSSSPFRLSTRRFSKAMLPMPVMCPTSSSITDSGNRKCGIWVRIMPPSRSVWSISVTS